MDSGEVAAQVARVVLRLALNYVPEYGVTRSLGDIRTALTFAVALGRMGAEAPAALAAFERSQEAIEQAARVKRAAEEAAARAHAAELAAKKPAPAKKPGRRKRRG